MTQPITIDDAVTTVFDAFRTEHTAAATTDRALRSMFDLFATMVDNGASANSILAACKASVPSVRDTAVRKAHGIPTSAAAVRGAVHVGRMLRGDDDLTTFDADGNVVDSLFEIRTAWAQATAVANESKHGGGAAALDDTLAASKDDTLSDLVLRLERLDEQVKRNRRKAEREAAAEQQQQQQQEQGTEGDESSESESEPTTDVATLLKAAQGTISKAASLRAEGQALTDEARAVALALVASLDTILAPSSVTVSEAQVAVVAQ